MAKKFEKKLLSSAMAVALGFGVSGAANAIDLAEDGVGQVLLAPYYTVQNGYTTKFAIVNTLENTAVKAKVVIRSKAQSTEVLDFICYLTPADVCRFEIRDVNGQATLWSDDDSIRIDTNTFASASNPVQQTLYDARMLRTDPNDINEVGHVEIIQGYAVRGTITTQAGVNVAISRGMTKASLASVFDANNRASNLANVAANPISAIASSDPTMVRLMGTVEMVKSGNTDRMGYRIPALDVSAQAGTYPGTATAFDGRVIANETHDVNISRETGVGLGWGPNSIDNIYEIETALASAFMEGVYDDDGALNHTNMLITFPTKYRHRISHICTPAANNILDDARRAEIANAFYTPPFRQNGAVEYGLSVFNNVEGKASAAGNVFSGVDVERALLYAEVNWHAPKWPAGFTSGWYSMSLVPATDPAHNDVCGYAGVPALGYTYNWMSVNNQVMNSTLIPASLP